MHEHDTKYLPLVKQIPGLSGVAVNSVKADSFGGAPTYFMVTELHFPDRETFKRAMETRENQMAGRELMGFAKGYVTLLVTESEQAAHPDNARTAAA